LGLINFNGRVMDPAQSDFLTPDPIISNPLDGQAWNPYSYVRNSPLNNTDPSGYVSCDFVAKGNCDEFGGTLGGGGYTVGGNPWAPAVKGSIPVGGQPTPDNQTATTSDTSGTTADPAPKWDNTCPETNTGCHDTDGTPTATETTIQTSDTSETAGWQTDATACKDDYCWDQYGNIVTQPAGDLVADEIVIHADPNLLTEFGDWLTRGIGHTYGDEDHIAAPVKTIATMCSDEGCIPISNKITWAIVLGSPEMDGPITQRSGQMPYADRVPDVKVVSPGEYVPELQVSTDAAASGAAEGFLNAMFEMDDAIDAALANGDTAAYNKAVELRTEYQRQWSYWDQVSRAAHSPFAPEPPSSGGNSSH
ncbi:RHS repeat-associated core domain-containing protein, partial [Streptomyces sp. NPDC005574]|uniref:RHS repeat-associated core domain-containing protein n=1 Tax=Streptomyces sp. NPDC005574 TaxID=3156891 RepID=UPI0033BB6A03